jgi:hypothetical protein
MPDSMMVIYKITDTNQESTYYLYQHKIFSMNKIIHQIITKEKTMIYKIPHRKLKIEQHEPH